MHYQNNYTSKSKIVKRHRILTMLEQGYLTIAQAAKELQLSARQVKRLRRRFKAGSYSMESLTFKSHRPWNKKNDHIRREVVKLKKRNPARSNQFIAEQIAEKLSPIHYSTVRNILIAENYYHKSRRKIKPAKRFETESFGEIVQMDTCEGYWLKSYNKRLNLIAILDDHSRFIVSAGIAERDTTWDNMLILREMVRKYGIPKVLYTDNDSKFKVIRHKDIPFWHPKPETYQTEIQRLCLELEIAHVTHQPFNPRAKGKVERFFRFIQDRFFPEHTAENLEELNRQLQEWLKWYNYQHVISTTKQAPAERLKPSIFRSLPANANLDNYFCFCEERMVMKDNAFSYGGKRYTIDRKHYLVGCRIDLRVTDKKIRIFCGGRFIQELLR